jgi:hypothetical protein
MELESLLFVLNPNADADLGGRPAGVESEVGGRRSSSSFLRAAVESSVLGAIVAAALVRAICVAVAEPLQEGTEAETPETPEVKCRGRERLS